MNVRAKQLDEKVGGNPSACPQQHHMPQTKAILFSGAYHGYILSRMTRTKAKQSREVTPTARH